MVSALLLRQNETSAGRVSSLSLVRRRFDLLRRGSISVGSWVYEHVCDHDLILVVRVVDLPEAVFELRYASASDRLEPRDTTARSRVGSLPPTSLICFSFSGE